MTATLIAVGAVATLLAIRADLIGLACILGASTGFGLLELVADQRPARVTDLGRRTAVAMLLTVMAVGVLLTIR